MQQENDAAPLLHDKPTKRIDLSPRRAKILIVAIVLIVGFSAVVPFYFSRYDRAPDGARVRRVIATHDLWMHLHTMEQFDKVLRSGVIYPRWVPDINHGYGILTLIYYPPGFFYLTSAFHAIFNDWLNTLFVITALALSASGLALYFLARNFYGQLASAVAAVLYMMLPMHMLDLYWRGGLPQFIGYIFPPMVIYFAYKLGREGKPRHYAGFAIFYGLHLLIHLPVSLMFTYALAFYAAFWAIKERDWRIGARFTGAMALGLLLSAIYWLPAALETKYAYEFASDMFPYHQSYITLAPVLDSNPYYDLWRLLNNIFAFNALALIVTILVLRYVRRARPAAGAVAGQWSPLGMWITMGVATTFMSTSFSGYISQLLPKIQVTVPAWRWLAIAAMFTSLIVAAAIDALRRQTAMSPRLLWACRAAVVVVLL
ncbi:MAG TPA: 6-pyruvoyl-tetrahydropterin synthase-related protein, partial [Blastocatellia bacterium]|nr:6-pyruvoyl-tetrahydropterin synthase-related protein [Blastocatellia bacterium]